MNEDNKEILSLLRENNKILKENNKILKEVLDILKVISNPENIKKNNENDFYMNIIANLVAKQLEDRI